jgi:hypothetical protein
MVMYMTNVADVPNWLLLLQQAGFEGCARSFALAPATSWSCSMHDSTHDHVHDGFGYKFRTRVPLRNLE